MISRDHETAVTPLRPGDLVAVAQCIAIDAEAFPFASAQFGRRSAGSPLWVARAGQEPRVLGFISTRHRRDDVDVEALAVTRDRRRRGVGRALLRAAFEHAHANAFRTVSLHVWAGNGPAIEMYRSEGFVVLRRLDRYYRAGTFDATGDAYEMVYQTER